VILANNDLSYYGRVLVRAMVGVFPDNYYILYTPYNISKTNKKLMSMLNEDSIRVKFPRAHIHNKRRWYKGDGIMTSLKTHGVNVYHGIDEQLPHGVRNGHIPSVVTLTDPLQRECGRWEGWLRRRRAVKAVAKAKRVVVLSEAARREVIEHYKVNADDVEVVYPCYPESCDEAVPDNMHDILREKYHLPEKFVLYKGRLNSEDNVEDVLRLIHELEDRKITLVMLGYRTDHFDSGLKNCARDEHVYHRFKQIDRVHHTDLSAVVRMAQAVIIPNTSRNRDRYKIINAQRCGAIVVCRDSEIAREYGGDGAIYYNTPEEGAEQLNRIFANEDSRQQLLTASMANTERFTPQQTAGKMMHIYRSILMHRRMYK